MADPICANEQRTYTHEGTTFRTRNVVPYRKAQKAHDPDDCEPQERNVLATVPRRLTPTECERLQGFPDGWTAEGADGPLADSPRYRMLGNAVTVSVAEWLGRRLLEHRQPGGPSDE